MVYLIYVEATDGPEIAQTMHMRLCTALSERMQHILGDLVNATRFDDEWLFEKHEAFMHLWLLGAPLTHRYRSQIIDRLITIARQLQCRFNALLHDDYFNYVLTISECAIADFREKMINETHEVDYRCAGFNLYDCMIMATNAYKSLILDIDLTLHNATYDDTVEHPREPRSEKYRPSFSRTLFPSDVSVVDV